MFERVRLIKLTQKLTGHSDHVGIASGWFDVLANLYNQAHRKYHTQEHITHLLARLDKLVPYSKPGWDRFTEAEVAIWFHDAVYDPRSRTNEEASALLARAFLFSVDVTDTFGTAGGHPGEVLENVQEAIMATKHDGRTIKGNAARIMVDLDLAHFADAWDVFDSSNKIIREEFKMYDDNTYRWGRVKFLSSLLNRKIYNVLQDLEGQAVVNIQRHIKDLVNV